MDESHGSRGERIVEWDLSQLDGQVDANPGAIVVDTRGEDHNRVWFVTRATGVDGQRVYRFDPFASLMKGSAAWRSWNLRADENAGGLKIKPSHDRRFVFVRTPQFIQRIDTQTCATGYAVACRTVWTPVDPNFPLIVSDIAVPLLPLCCGPFPNHEIDVPPTGSGSLTPTFVAVDGPLFDTITVYVVDAPGTAEL